MLIARVIAKKPELLVLDEPVQGVDFKGEISLYELINLYLKKQIAVFYLYHDLHVVMSADYVYASMDTYVVLELQSIQTVINIGSCLGIELLRCFQFMSIIMTIVTQPMEQ